MKSKLFIEIKKQKHFQHQNELIIIKQSHHIKNLPQTIEYLSSGDETMYPDTFSNRTSLLLSWTAGQGGCYYFKVHHNIFPCDASELGLNESTMGCLSTKISLLFGCFIQRESHVFVGWPGQLCCVNWCQATSAIYQLARRLKPWTRPLVSQTTRRKIRFQASSLTNIYGWRGVTATVTRQETGQPTSVWYVSRSPLNWRACKNIVTEKTLEQVSFLGGRRISTKMIIF